MSKWTGKSKGTPAGYRFFIFIINRLGIGIAYTMLRFVTLYYFFFSSKKHPLFLYRKVLGYGRLKAMISVYRNFFIMGQVLIDKVAILSGQKHIFSFQYCGEEHIRNMAAAGKGGLLLGAHMGNWEVAGQLLERIDTPVHILMLDAENEKLKATLNSAMTEKSISIIPIKDDTSHLAKIKEALARGEFIAMHADRMLPGASHAVLNFMGKPAKFPTGPMYLASKHAVPVSFVYAMKEKGRAYKFYATEPFIYKYPAKLPERKKELAAMAASYARHLEEMLAKYPLQWFNFYQFWEENPIKQKI
jgi:predicted LPLAT superfamily acyltransferase